MNGQYDSGGRKKGQTRNPPLYSNESKCFYDLKYVRFSSNNLFGVVRENLKLKNEMYAKIKVPHGIEESDKDQ